MLQQNYENLKKSNQDSSDGEELTELDYILLQLPKKLHSKDYMRIDGEDLTHNLTMTSYKSVTAKPTIPWQCYRKIYNKLMNQKCILDRGLRIVEASVTQ